MSDELPATRRARDRFSAQVRIGFITMLGLCVTMLVINS